MSGTTTPARRRPGDDDADSDDDHDGDDEPDPEAGTRDPGCRVAARSRDGRRTGRCRRRRTRRGQRAGRGADERRTRRRARRAGRPWSRTRRSAAPSAACWRSPTSTPNTTRPTRPAGTVLGSVIMKNRKISTSGEVTITRQKSNPQTGANAQRAVMQWPDAARTPTPTVSAIQNVAASGEQVQPPGDQQAAAEDDGVGRDHPDVQRRPPEVERLDARAAEHDEGDDQPDVRRVEEVRAAVPDDVLRQQREGGDAREHVPLVGAPGIVGRRPDDAQDERHAAAGQHRARRPDERRGSRKVSATSRTAHVRIAARICGTLTWKSQPDLAEDVDRDDDGGDVQPRVAGVRQDHADRCVPTGCPRRDVVPATAQRAAGHEAASPVASGPSLRSTANSRSASSTSPSSTGPVSPSGHCTRTSATSGRRRARRGSSRAGRRRARRRP